MTTRRDVIAAISLGTAAFSIESPRSRAAQASPEVSRTSEAIHQEVVFDAAPSRLFRALTDAREFHKVELLSAAVKSGMVSAKQSARIEGRPGGAFALFGAHISGRFIELLQDKRIVQAWRAGDWAPGAWSIARFELSGEAGATRLVFDHTGFPAGLAEHLAAGWHANYWEPLLRSLSGS